MENKSQQVKSEFKSQVNGASKVAKDTLNSASNSASDTATDLLATVTEFGKNFLTSMGGSKEKALQAATTTLSALDKTIKSRPAAYVGGAVVLGFIAGYFLGKGRSPTSSLRSSVDKIKDQIEKNINKVSEHLQ